MKRHLSIFLISIAAISSLAAQTIIETLRTRDAITVIQPILMDSINPHGKKYSVASILSNPVSIDLNKIPTQNITADTAGVFMFSLPESNPQLHIMETKLRAERFFKGSLKITSSARFEALINGKQEAIKETSDDFSSSSASKEIALRLEPQKTYTLSLKLLTSPTDSVIPQIKIAVIPDNTSDSITIFVSPELQRRLEVPDLTYGKRVSAIEFSPNGNFYLTHFSESYKEGNTMRYASLKETRSGKLIASRLESVGWLPTGATLYKFRQAKEGFDLYTINPNNLSEQLIAENLPSDKVEFTPDMKYFFYSETDKGETEEGPMRRYVNQEDRIPDSRTRTSIKRYNFATGMTESITFGRDNTELVDISPDSEKILYATIHNTPDKYPFAVMSLYQLNLKTQRIDTIIAADGHFNGASYSPDGKKVLITGGPLAFNNLGKNCDEHPIANDFDTQIYILDIESGNVTPATFDFAPAVQGSPKWNRTDGNIYFIGEDGFYNRLYMLNPKSGKIVNIPADIENISRFSIPMYSAERIAYCGTGYEYSGRAGITDLRNGKATIIEDPMHERLSQIELGKTEPWKFTASDGTTIDGNICYPPDFNPAKKYPLIVYYYGGTSPSDRSLIHPYSPQMFASRGYVTYVLNPSGTTGYGQEFSARHVNAWGKRTADDIIEGTKKFVEEHSYIDHNKIGCLGASYGGFMTQYLQTLTDIFAAAVSHAGISNVTSYWGEGYWGYSYNSIAAAESYPWTNPELFTKQGSLFNADKIHTPLLLLHGTEDTNVPIGESIQIFNALKILGRDVEFITVDGENHVITNVEKRQLWQDTIMAWFAKWLQGDSRWWDDLYPERHL